VTELDAEVRPQGDPDAEQPERHEPRPGHRAIDPVRKDEPRPVSMLEVAEGRFSQALSLLREGRFAEAWPLYEARKALSRITLLRPIAQFPEWRGEDIAGRRIVVCAEQGFGDQIMWGRYMPLLTAAGAEVVVVTHPRLMRLFETLGYWTRPALTDQPLPAGDYWVHFGSVPLHLAAHAVPAARYLNVEGDCGGGIGVLSVASTPGRSLREPYRSGLLTLGRDLDPAMTGAFDFLDTARIIAGLDLVISVDTAVVNLAAALGRPTWALLPPEADFRWGRDGRSAWYPEVVQHRLNSPDDWRAVLENAGAWPIRS
jgi:hypothetical protein